MPGAAIFSHHFALSHANSDADALTAADAHTHTHTHTVADIHADSDPDWHLSVRYRLSHRDQYLPGHLVTCG